MAEKNRQRYNTGVVKHYDEKKGFGFIAPDNGSEELFVHHSSVLSYGSGGIRRLVQGDAVEFVIYMGGDGRTKAVDVKFINNRGPVQGSKIRRRGGNGYKTVGEGGRRGGDYGVRGGGYGGGGKSCFNCGEVGRVEMNCNQGGGGGGRGGCHKCGEDGHFARECPNGAR